MKIALYTSAFQVLSETFILNQITGLIDRGHSIQIVVNRMGDTSLIHDDVTHYGLLEKIYFSGDSYELMPKNKIKRVTAALKLFFNGNKVPKLLLLKSLNYFLYGKDALTLNLFFRCYHDYLSRSDIDIALCHFGHNGELAARVKDVGALQCKLATIFHGYDLSRDLLANPTNIYRFLFKRCDLFMPVSNHWKSVLNEIGCDRNKIAVHHMGIELTPLEHKDRIQHRLVSVARFVEKKGLQYAVDAFSEIAKRYPDAHYVIIGDGPLRGELETQIANLLIVDRVTLTGPLTADRVRQELLKASVFVLPSVTASDGDKEGIPVVLMEAMSYELPIATTFHSGIPELVENKVSGLLSEERDSGGLSDNIETLLSDRQLALRLGRAGRNKISQEFDIDKLNDKLVLLFQETLIEPE